MHYTKTPKGYIIRLVRGEELIETLTNFFESEKIHSGIFQAVGASEQTELGFYHLDTHEYEWKVIESPCEIVSLTGNVALVEGKAFLHIHCVISDSSFQCFGGHLKKAIVGATCEVYFSDHEVDIERKQNEEVGLKLLSCEATT